MATKDLFEQAIADAKKLKQISIANAKQTIEEAFAPKIQEMFRLKLSEMEDHELEEGMEDELGYGEGNQKPQIDVDNVNDSLDSSNLEEASLDEILAELELEEADDAYSDKEPHQDIKGTEKGWVGGKKDVKGTEKGWVGGNKIAEAKKADDADDADDVGSAEEGDESGEVLELSIDEFKDLIRDVVADAMSKGMTPAEDGENLDTDSEEPEEGSETTEDEPISLDEILAEMENMENTEDSTEELSDLLNLEGSLNEDFGTIQGIINAISSGQVDSNFFDANGPLFGILTGIPIFATVLGSTFQDEIKNMLMNLKSKSPIKKMIELVKAIKQKVGKRSGEVIKGLVNGMKSKLSGKLKTPETAQLQEAAKAIKYLKTQLTEVNLLNAKLLYVNKIFKSKTLTESQKVKVVTAFDKAITTREAKNIYETLVDSINQPVASRTKAPLKESLGFASKPIGSAPATPIIEADAYVYRMQQLAGIKSPNI